MSILVWQWIISVFPAEIVFIQNPVKFMWHTAGGAAQNLINHSIKCNLFVQFTGVDVFVMHLIHL